MSERNITKYKASKTITAFMQSNARRRVIMGPFGSGKSSGCCVEVVRRAIMQAAYNGVRRSRWAIVRNTMPQLRDTTMKTWFDWFPNGSIGYYMQTGKTYFIKQGGLDAEVIFRALDDEDDVKNLLSLEVSGAYFNECREIPQVIIDAMDGRIGRYPRAEDGGCTWKGIWADTNAPEEDSYWYRLIEGLDPESGNPMAGGNGWESYKQPSGLAPDAENLEYLNQTPESLLLTTEERRAIGRTYYTDLAVNRPAISEFIKVYVRGEYGSSKAGKPVHSSFNREWHVAKHPLTPNPHLPVVIGADFGLTPAMTLKQQDVHGRVLTLDEIVTEEMGLQRAIRTKLKPLIARKYPNFRFFVTGDPAGKARAQTDENTCVKIFQGEGFKKVRFAKSNAPLARHGATSYFLETLTPAGPAALIDPGCRVYAKGLESGYHYPINKKGIASDSPEKNMSSHICEAGEYADMYFQAGHRDQGAPLTPEEKHAIARVNANAGVYAIPR